MIYEGDNPSYKEVIESARNTARVICNHGGADEDFWKNARRLTYGDILLCQQCGQYFTRIKHLMIISDSKEILDPKPGIGKLTIKPQAKHVEKDCWIRVPVRVIDA